MRLTDACPRESLNGWLSYLRRDHPAFLFRAASEFLPEPPTGPPGKDVAKRPINDGLGVEALLTALKQEAKRKGSDPLVVVVVGVANVHHLLPFLYNALIKNLKVGKSAIVNSLCKKRACTVYKPAAAFESVSTTKRAQAVSIDVGESKLKLIDTPALSFKFPSPSNADELPKLRAQDSLLRNQGRIDRVKDPAPAGE